MCEIVQANAERCERVLASQRERYDRLPPGDPGIPDLVLGMSKAAAEARHWREYLGYYRQRMAKEGPNVKPRMWRLEDVAPPPVARAAPEIADEEIPF